MTDQPQDALLHDLHLPGLAGDGIDRRGFLKCMAWAGTGALCVMQGGVLRSYALEGPAKSGGAPPRGELSFVQISDSHMGFNKAANPDVVGTFKAAIERINALPEPPAFLLHTGDITHLSKPEEFDTVTQLLKEAKAREVFYVPGEHDVLGDNGRQFLDRFGKGSHGGGWHSFDKSGVHFIGLVNVLNLKAGGLGSLGREQLEWLEDDVRHLSKSTPIVVFAHVPLWTVYGDWGWGTEDAAQALSYLKKFGSVAVLNGHIHQTMQKVEGNVTFHTACSTAFPQPAPGSAPGPGPMQVPAERLRALLGLSQVRVAHGKGALGITDLTLEGTAAAAPAAAPAAAADRAPAAAAGATEVKIDNFVFSPADLAVARGTTVSWVNRDDMPHTVTSRDKVFASPTLDTDQRFSYTFAQAGTFPYYCTIHPMMTARVVVR
jgi:plastocyanin